ncbi:MAG: hypothetical protein IJK86_06890 [Lachnospiraceae bacterium]|nr:hypothetical protein [Lachnospiraceae bacterium]
MSLKKTLSILMLITVLLLTACGNQSGTAQKTDGVDVDLSKMGGAVVYGKVYDMVNNGANYEGQVVRMAGVVNEIPVTQRGVQVDTLYSCVIFDATKCCSQGIEFVLPEGTAYPAVGTEVVVQGVWNNYQLYGIDRYRLLDAKIL